MSNADRGRPATRATLADFLAIPEDERFHELINGELERKSSPAAEHGRAQRKLGAAVDPFDQPPGGRPPGGWWVMTEVEISLVGHIFRPDVVGWRRDRVPACPTGTPVEVRPDWICEVLSPASAGRDRVKKLNHYCAAGVPHDWLLDPAEETLAIYRHTPDGYLLALAAGSGQRVRAEPFDAIELDVAELFGREDAPVPG